MAKKLSDLALTIDPFSQINDTQFGFGASLGSLYNAGGSNEISSPRSWASIAKQSATPTIPEIPSTQTPSSSDSTLNKNVAPTQDLAPPVDNAPNPYLPPAIDFTIPELPPINADLTPDLTGIEVPNLPPVDVVAPDLTGIEVPNLPPVDVVAPDLTGIEVPSLPPVDVAAPDLTGIEVPSLPPVDVVAPDLTGIEVPSLPPVDVVAPDLTGIEVPPVDVVAPDLTGIDVPTAPPVDTGINLSAPVLPKFDGIDLVEVGKALDEFLNPAKKEIEKLRVDLGLSTDLTDDASLKLGDPTRFGQVGIGNGAYVDMSEKSKQLYKDAVTGTSLESVNPDDLYSFLKDPKKFVIDKGSDAAGGLIDKITGSDSLFGVDGSTGQALADILKGKSAEEVTADIAKRAILDTTKQEITKQFGKEAGSAAFDIIAGILNGENADQIAIDIAKNTIKNEIIKQGGSLVGGGLVSIIDGILSGKRTEVVAANVATAVAVEVIGTALDATIPGVGTLFKIAVPILMNLLGQKAPVVLTAEQQMKVSTDKIISNFAYRDEGEVKNIYQLILGEYSGQKMEYTPNRNDVLGPLTRATPDIRDKFANKIDEKLASVGITHNTDPNSNQEYIVRKDIADKWYADKKQARIDQAIDASMVAVDKAVKDAEIKRDKIKQERAQVEYNNSPAGKLAAQKEQEQAAQAAQKEQEQAAQAAKAQEEYNNSPAGKRAAYIEQLKNRR